MLSGRRQFLSTGLALGFGALGLAGCSASSGDKSPRGGGTTPSSDGLRPPSTVAYGGDSNQVGDLYLPSRNRPGPRPVPVVVLMHGGFWLNQYGRDLMADLAVDMARRGWVAWNIEYRRVGQRGGGWPGTFTDIAAAVDHVDQLADERGDGQLLDRKRVAVVGHSAGGQLATWSAARPGLPADAPGAKPAVTPIAVVSQAGVLDLVEADREGVGGAAVADFMGGSAGAEPGRYALGSPIARIPIGVPVRCVHGRSDANVPFSQSERYVKAASKAGDPAELAPFDGDHFDVLDPRSRNWAAAAAWLQARFETS